MCMAPRFPPVLLLVSILLTGGRAAADGGFSGLAFVRDDASLGVDGREVRLYGIYIPPAGEDCHAFLRPVRCGSQAKLALDFRIRGFVHCKPMEEADGRHVTAQCRVDRNGFDEGEDLSAYLIRRGWALALPDAPYEYQALEKIARHRGVGVWGVPRAVRR